MLPLIKGLFLACICLKIILTIIYYIVAKNNFDYNQAKTDDSNENNDEISIIKDAMISLRHDYNNIIQAIDGYIKLNDFNGLKTYYNDLLIDCEWRYIKR